MSPVFSSYMQVHVNPEKRGDVKSEASVIVI